MGYSVWLALGLLSIMTLSISANDQYINEGAQIFNTIFHKYSTKVPPRKKFPEPIQLGVNVNVVHVQSVNKDAQTMTSTFDLEVAWKDNRLSWYPKTVQEIVIPLTEVWSPDLSVSNAVGKVDDLSSSKVVLKATGEVRWKRRIRTETLCEWEDTSAICSITIGSSLLDNAIISFDRDTSVCSGDDARTSSQLDIESADMELTTFSSKRDVNTTFAAYSCALNITVSEGYRPPINGAAYVGPDNGVDGLYNASRMVLVLLGVLVYAFAQK